MKAVILAGGYGTRLAEETWARPKPLVEIGGRPILWHILKLYAAHGIEEFVIACGYKGQMIKQYFRDYALSQTDFTVDLRTDRIQVHRSHAEPWRVTLVDTGEATQTGGRLKRLQRYLEGATFCLTYGDGVGDIDIRALIETHRRLGRLATVTAVSRPGRYGAMELSPDQARVVRFTEKLVDSHTVNAGFAVLEPRVFDYIAGDATEWEREPLERLAAEGQLAAYRHQGFWHSMDTLRDKQELEKLWQAGAAPWKVWE